MATGQSSHTTTDWGNVDHMNNQNGLPTHTHIPRIYNGVDLAFNSFKHGGGGVQECGICGEVLNDVQK